MYLKGIIQFISCIVKNILLFRYPEAGVVETTNPYCAISQAHTMCQYSGPSTTANLVHYGLSDDLEATLTDKLNE